MFIGKGDAYMREVATALREGFADGTLEQRPTLVNLQSDIDHPTQTMADVAHLIHHFGGVEALRGKKLAMSWAYSPSYGKPLSVPQGVVALATRFGMEVVLAHPHGYGIMPEVEVVARHNAEASGGSFTKTSSMSEAFEGADVVYPKSWAPYAAMEQRTALLEAGDEEGIAALEHKLLAQNAEHEHWECTEELMATTGGRQVQSPAPASPSSTTTSDNQALYLHCLPADISGVSCEHGEVAASVFDRYRAPLYREASFKPYLIAAMIVLAKVADPATTLAKLAKEGAPRFAG
jgi:knotted carbamoyltransferase YgeW